MILLEENPFEQIENNELFIGLEEIELEEVFNGNPLKWDELKKEFIKIIFCALKIFYSMSRFCFLFFSNLHKSEFHRFDWFNLEKT